jgi:membrane peptidoglycan carboxypeptidase
VAGKPTNPNPWPALAKLLGVIVVGGILAAGVALPFVGGIGLAARHEADKFLGTTCNLQETQEPLPSTITASDGHTVIARLFTQDRRPVNLSAIPKYLIQALVATEDRRFYSHHGVDMRGLIRSAISTSGGATQGGSTLTMQYVKQVRYYQDIGNLTAQQADVEQTLNRKIEDAQCAIAIEKNKTKNQILDSYLNIAFFGENAYSIESAAQTYFGVDVNKLSLTQSAMLVGLLKAPTEYDPFQNPSAARDRRNEVLQNLVAVGNLSQAAATRAEATPVSLATSSAPPVRRGCANSPSTIVNIGFFCDYAVKWLLDNKVVTESELNTGGLKIITTLNAKLQNSMQAHLKKTIPASSPMTSVMPVVDPHTGNVLAMATSKYYGQPTSAKDHTHTSLPIFTEYSALGASTYKLFPLLTALAAGVPSTFQLELPVQGQGYKWTACAQDDNHNKVTDGDANVNYNRNETLASATAKSSNTYYVGLADQLFGCNLQPIIDMASRLGMNALSQPGSDRGLTVAQDIVKLSNPTILVLGDIATSPLEITGAYAGVANNGKFNTPAPIISVTDRNGNSRTVPRTPGVQVVAPQVAMQAIQILTGDTTYPGTSAQPFSTYWYDHNSSVVAGKTGTAVASNSRGQATSKNGAIWFVGVTPDLVSTDAIFNLDGASQPSSGLPGERTGAAYGEYAAQVWLKVLEPYLVNKQWTWPDPSQAVGVDVPSVIGLDKTAAQARLRAAGFTMRELGPTGTVLCASTVGYNNVAYEAPQRALPGSTIIVCLSSGVQQQTYVPPPPIRSKTPTPPAGSTTPAGGSTTPGGGNTTPGGGNTGTGGHGPPH